MTYHMSCSFSTFHVQHTHGFLSKSIKYILRDKNHMWANASFLIRVEPKKGCIKH